MDDGPLMLAKRVVNRIGRPFGINPFPRAFGNSLFTHAAPSVDVFNRIWCENYWQSSESRSGVGSEITFVSHYRRGLEALMQSRGFGRLFDAPCGDLSWMSGLVDNAKLDYSGGDVSPLVVRHARRHYPQLDVRVFDITTDVFPEADVWHCRDCLFHLPLRDVRRALKNFAESNIRYALVTTHRSWLVHRNLDVMPGGFRYLDLEIAPICLPKAEHYIRDFRLGHDFPRYVGLWSRDAVAHALARSCF